MLHIRRGIVQEAIEATMPFEIQSSPANFASNPELFEDTNWSGLTISDTGDGKQLPFLLRKRITQLPFLRG